MLNAIGFWITNLRDDALPSPQELVGDMPASLREQLASYLTAGHRFRQFRGYSWCRFDCGIQYSQMGSWDLTDGTWVWPEGLPHYVREHGIVLPSEFVAHVLAGAAPRQPSPSEEISADFWRQWSATRRSSEFLKALRTAQDSAEVWISAAKAELPLAVVEAQALHGGLRDLLREFSPAPRGSS